MPTAHPNRPSNTSLRPVLDDRSGAEPPQKPEARKSGNHPAGNHPEGPFPRPASAPRLVIGCGNLLRGDDAAGPLVVRRLGGRYCPADLRCLDAGTAGLDVVLAMQGAGEVTIVDACRSGAEPGTILELSGDDLAEIDSSIGLSIHDLRWSDALAFGRTLFVGEAPASLRVWLVEGAAFEPGSPLTPAVDQAVDRLVERLLAGRPATAHGQSEAASALEIAACPDAGGGG